MASNLNQKVERFLKPLKSQAVTPEGKRKILDEFNDKVRRVGGIERVIDKLKLLYHYFRDPETHRAKKALAGAALLYFILPADVIPDLLPGVGYVDDAAAVAMVWKFLSDEMAHYEHRIREKGKE